MKLWINEPGRQDRMFPTCFGFNSWIRLEKNPIESICKVIDDAWKTRRRCNARETNVFLPVFAIWRQKLLPIGEKDHVSGMTMMNCSAEASQKSTKTMLLPLNA